MHVLVTGGEALREVVSQQSQLTDCRVSFFELGQNRRAQVQDQAPDAVVLDGEGAGFESLDLIRELRSLNVHCVCVLVASQLVDSAVNALFRAGGDDYLVAPVSPEYLLNRIRVSMARREIQPTAVAELILGPLRLDALERVFVNGAPCDIPKKERMLLRLLVQRAGSLVRHEELRALGWCNLGKLGSNSLEVHISRLRGWLRGALKDNRLEIVSTRGVGYTLALHPSTSQG